MTRLIWKRVSGKGTTPLIGLLGKHRVCSIVYGMIRDPRGCYYLQFTLPSIDDFEDRKYSFKEEDLQHEAENILSNWFEDAGVLE